MIGSFVLRLHQGPALLPELKRAPRLILLKWNVESSDLDDETGPGKSGL